jgi:hypothetical protein
VRGRRLRFGTVPVLWAVAAALVVAIVVVRFA